MYLMLNADGEIKGVGITTDPELKSVFIDDELSPFKGWSEAKICCYKVEVSEGVVTMMTPYVDSRLLEHFNQVGLSTEVNAEEVKEARAGLIENFEQITENIQDIEDCRAALMELYGLIIGE